jgi:NAD(P)-dependent dehydrogenase (short-subunit alcohol dehydrogenase family)
VGQLAVTQAFLPMLRRSRGRIVNTGSVSGLLAMPLLGPYCMSKFALEALSDSLRLELRQWGIEVVLLEPGQIATPIWEKGLRAGDHLEQEAPEGLLELYGPLIEAMRNVSRYSQRIAQPADLVARAVVHAFTARRPRARYVMGGLGWQQKVLAMLPTRLRDRLLARQLRLPPTG